MTPCPAYYTSATHGVTPVAIYNMTNGFGTASPSAFRHCGNYMYQMPGGTCDSVFYLVPGVDGALNSRGSSIVAAEGRAAVEKYQAKIAAAGERPWLHVVDGHNMTRNACWATWVRDGRHYPFIQPLKVERMLSVLEDYLP